MHTTVLSADERTRVHYNSDWSGPVKLVISADVVRVGFDPAFCEVEIPEDVLVKLIQARAERLDQIEWNKTGRPLSPNYDEHGRLAYEQHYAVLHQDHSSVNRWFELPVAEREAWRQSAYAVGLAAANIREIATIKRNEAEAPEHNGQSTDANQRDVHKFMAIASQPIGDLRDPLLTPLASEHERASLAVAAKLCHLAADVLKAAAILAPNSRSLRGRFIAEETGEFLDAMVADDLAGAADALADLEYVLKGAAVTFGIDLGIVWRAVHTANMAKFPDCGTCNANGSIQGLPYDDRDGPVTCPRCNGLCQVAIRDAGGKVLKPPGWTAPDIGKVLLDQVILRGGPPDGVDLGEDPNDTECSTCGGGQPSCPVCHPQETRKRTPVPEGCETCVGCPDCLESVPR